MSNYSGGDPRTGSGPNRMFSSIPPNLAQQQKMPHHMSAHSMPQMAYSHHSSSHPAFQIKKEISFPPDSIEATTPTFVKRRRLTPRDINQVEPWRLFMCLKSGLLAESTWAIDILSILMYDDSTVLYFGLQHLPGLLEVLLEHY